MQNHTCKEVRLTRVQQYLNKRVLFVCLFFPQIDQESDMFSDRENSVNIYILKPETEVQFHVNKKEHLDSFLGLKNHYL